MLHGDSHPFRTHHDGRLSARLDRGVAGTGLQRGAQDVHLDVIAIGTSGLATLPEIGLPDESGDEHRRGPVVDFGRCADLLDVPRVHHRDPIAHRQRFLLVVGHVDEGDPDLALDSLEFELHDVAQLEVQRSERLVEQQSAGVVDQGAGQRNPLLLTAGKLRGFAFREVGQPDHLEHLVDALGDRRFVLALAARSVGDVVPHGHVRE